MNLSCSDKPKLVVLASTYPRWVGDPEPAFVHELSKRLCEYYSGIVIAPHSAGAKHHELMDGVEIFRYQYAPEKYQTLVSAGGILANLKRNPIKWVLLPSFFLGQYLALRKICLGNNIALIHAHWIVPQGLVAAMWCFFSKQRYRFMVTAHGADIFALKNSIYTLLKRWVLNRADRVTVVSRVMLSNLLDQGVCSQKLTVLPMGVDTQKLFVSSRETKKSGIELLFVGRLVEKKGLKYLLAILPAILKQYPSLKLTIAGFGPEESNLRSLAEKLHIANAVDFLGAVKQKDLPALYQRASLFVAPFIRTEIGDQEGLPVVLMEAIACGCPILVGNVPGLEDLLGHLEDKVSLDVRDQKLFFARLQWVLNNLDQYEIYTNEIYHILQGRYDWMVISQAYANIFDSMLKINSLKT